MCSLAEKIEIQIAENGRKAIGIVQFNDIAVEIGAQRVVCHILRKRTDEQAGIVNKRQLRRTAIGDDSFHTRSVRQKRSHHVAVIFGMPAQIMKRIGMAAFDDGIGFCGKGHGATSLLGSSCP